MEDLRHPSTGPRAAALCLASALALWGCTADEPHYSESTLRVTVEQQIDSGCSTSVVLPLSHQIADEMTCIMPGVLETFDEEENIVFAGSAVIGLISPGGLSDLRQAAGQAGGLRINSGFRSVAQQYLLREWFERGRCGITAAAPPGASNHESGRALDIGNYGAAKPALESTGWLQTVPGDPVHFDHLASQDLRGYDVLAFQRLWNRNHPDDLIDEDASYGPATASRLRQAPSEGFPVGACPMDDFASSLLAVDAPASAPADTAVSVVIEIENTGGVAWRPDATFLGTIEPEDRDSELYDEETWYASNRPATVEAITEPGDVGVFRFSLRTPDVDSATEYRETLRLVEESVTWFGDPIGISLTVGPDIEVEETSSDAPGLVGGCSAASSEPPLWLGVLVLLALRRARRRSGIRC